MKLRQLGELFSPKLFAGPDGTGAPAAGPAESPGAPVAPAATQPSQATPVAPAAKTVAMPDERYYGSADLNPEQRPLRIDTSKMSKQEVDEILQGAEPSEIFKTDEEIGAEKKKPDEKPPEKPGAEKPAEETDLSKEFIEESGIKAEDFAKLPEAIQEKFVEQFVATKDATDRLASATKEFEEVKANWKTVELDPIIAARMEELQTGKAFVAQKLAPATEEELKTIDSMVLREDFAGAKSYINKMIETRAKVAIEHERSVLNARAAEQQLRKDTEEVFRDLGKLDPRLSISETEWKKINPANPALWKEWTEKIGDVKEMCIRKNITMSQIKQIGAKGLLAMYSTEKGWDKETQKQIYKSGKEAILKALRNPQKAASSLQQGKPGVPPMSGKSSTGAAIDRDSLIEQMVSGDSSNYFRLLELHDGDENAISTLDYVRKEANRRRSEVPQ